VIAGETVTAGQTIACFAGQGCVEIGWSATPGAVQPEAAALGQQAQGAGEDPGSNRTYCGQSMSDLLQSLGAPRADREQAADRGPMLSGWRDGR